MDDSVLRALVKIMGVRGSAQHFVGTGFLFYRDVEGTYALTCAHVVEAGRQYEYFTLDDYRPIEVVFEERDATDLAVLRSTAEPLRDRPLLELGAFNVIGKAMTYGERTYIPHFQSLDYTKDRPLNYRYTMKARGPLMLTPGQTGSRYAVEGLFVANDSAAKIMEGDSGSPVIEIESRRVIGVIRRLVSNGEVVEATAITELAEAWKDMPADIVFHQDIETSAAARLAAEIDLFAKAKALVEPLKLRLLFALSPASQRADSLSGERANIIEIITQVFVESNLHEQLDVELLEWRNPQQAWRVVSTTSAEPALVPLPPLHELSLVTIVAWHDLGASLGAQAELEWLYDQTRRAALDSASGLPRLMVYRRSDYQLSPDDAEFIAKQQRYFQLKAFFDRIGPERYTLYPVRSFATWFALALQTFVASLLDQAARTPADSGGSSADRAPRGNPFRGLAPYEETHAAQFFGRADEINALTEQLSKQLADEINALTETEQLSKQLATYHLLAVVGASGSGKSSLVRAGLLPRLKRDGIPESQNWLIVILRLSEDSERPLDVVVDHLANCYPEQARPDKKELRALLRDIPDGISQIADALLAKRPASARLLLFIDQFEELFTLVDDDQRAAFVKFLVKALQAARVLLVVTVRADFYHRCLDTTVDPDFPKWFKAGTYWLMPPERAALLKMIAHPVLFSGATFEDVYLMFEILDDTGSSQGALPLMSYALEQLYDRCRGDQLTRDAYDALGRVGGVIQQQAEKALNVARHDFTTDEVQGSLKTIFSHLVGVDENVVATKKPARYTQVATSPAAKRLVDVLVDYRLLQSNAEDGAAIVSIAHEAVLNHWQELHAWIVDAREALQLIHRVESAASEWQLARSAAQNETAQFDIDRARLWSQDRLDKVDEALKLLGTPSSELSAEVRAFLRPEFDRLMDELQHHIQHERRAQIGNRLAEIGDGDPRRGVGLRNGLPDIVWCPVPGGEVKLRDVTNVFQVKPFYIAQYPITLRQFKVFTAGGNYFTKQWWEGLATDPDQHKPMPQTPEILNHPAQYVSWYQAMAFCRWLSAKLGYEVRLPTEGEWVQAATGGYPDYNYPWGPDCNLDNANHKEGTYRLMSVGMYPAGASPVHALDMSGNMYEWCLNEFEDPTNTDPGSDRPHTTRGGAFFTMPSNIDICEQLSVHHRLQDNANGTREQGQRIAVGLRLVCEHPPAEALSDC